MATILVDIYCIEVFVGVLSCYKRILKSKLIKMGGKIVLNKLDLRRLVPSNYN